MHNLLDGPRSHLTEEEVLTSLEAEHGAQVQWGIDVINPEDLSERGINVQMISGTISWQQRVSENFTGGTPQRSRILRTATVKVKDIQDFNWLANYYRPWVRMRSPLGPDPITYDGTQATYNGDDAIYTQYNNRWVRWNMGIYTVTMPTAAFDGTHVERTLEMAERTHQIHGRTLSSELAIEVDTNPIEWIKTDLDLRFGINDWSQVEDTIETLDETLVFESGETRLEVYNSLLEYIGYDWLFTDGEGRPVMKPVVDFEDEDAVVSFGPGNILVLEGDIEPINPELPNVVVFVATHGPSLPEEGNGIRTVYNEDQGPGSLEARGGVIVSKRIEVDAKDQESLDRIAKGYAQFYFGGGGWRYVGAVGLYPRIAGHQDVVFLDKPAFGVAGRWVVTGWEMSVGPMTDESAATTNLEMEWVSGSTFATDRTASAGAFGTIPFAKQQFGNLEVVE